MTDSAQGTSDGSSKVVIRDRRKVDPQTGAPRQVATTRVGTGEAAESATPETGTAAGAKAGDELATLRTQLAERTADLKRVTAEYANYRKRVDRDRTIAAEQATAVVLTMLLPVLDDLDRARAHGDLTGAFGAVAEQLVNALTKLGLQPFGEVGDPFDPTWHEAVAHTTRPDVEEATCVEVLRRGYSFGDRLLRAAMVTVADPAAEEPAGAGSEPESATADAPASDATASTTTEAGPADGVQDEAKGDLAAGGQSGSTGDVGSGRPGPSVADDQTTPPDRLAEMSGDAANRG